MHKSEDHGERKFCNNLSVVGLRIEIYNNLKLEMGKPPVLGVRFCLGYLQLRKIKILFCFGSVVLGFQFGLIWFCVNSKNVRQQLQIDFALKICYSTTVWQINAKNVDYAMYLFC